MRLNDDELVLLLGSNLGDSRMLFEKAKKEIAISLGPITNNSSYYQSEAWGFESKFPFLNQVIVLNSKEKPHFILEKLKEIEVHLGREKKKSEIYLDRTIDIDILFYGNRIVKTKELNIPHIQIPNRRFTLLPLAELYPQVFNSELGMTVNELLLSSKDESQVEKLMD